ncbi:MAG: hypothetical protein EBT75_06225 [Proteobacteria bacterium]|nr:hypothetical protein [Pseudomonadota bacterium]NBS07133.1 hypothetical protein [Verrucomicrobiota bacterium]NBS50217.1 hypothetical protein [Verrucomicrobiota bacterium]
MGLGNLGIDTIFEFAMEARGWLNSYMIHREKLLTLALIFSVAFSSWAQKAVTGEEVQANPQIYDGKKVFIYVDSVNFPARSTNQQKGFSDYWVVTAIDSHWGQSSKNGSQTIGDRDKSGAVFVRVALDDTEKFNNDYSAKAGKGLVGARKKITGTFRANKSGDGGYIDLTDGSSIGIDAPPRHRNSRNK